MKMKSLILGAAVFAFAGPAFAGGCGSSHYSSAKMDIKKAPIAQSTKTSEIKKIELAAVPTDAWLIKFLA